MSIVETKLLKLVYDYSINYKYADQNFIYEVISLLGDGLSDYIKTIDNKSLNSSSFCFYNIENKTVSIDILKEVEYELLRIRLEGLPNSKYEVFLKVNLSVVNAIAHELEHARQYKKCLEGATDLESKLLESAYEKNLFLLRNGQPSSEDRLVYFKALAQTEGETIYYTSSPSERMAKIRGLEYEKLLGNSLVSDACSSIGDYTNLRYIRGQKLGYTGECAPTPFFELIKDTIRVSSGLKIKASNYDALEYKYDKMGRNLTLDEKLYYGFPISISESDEINRRTIDLQKKLIKKNY